MWPAQAQMKRLVRFSNLPHSFSVLRYKRLEIRGTLWMENFDAAINIGEKISAMKISLKNISCCICKGP